jgi:hypothetical protein
MILSALMWILLLPACALGAPVEVDVGRPFPLPTLMVSSLSTSGGPVVGAPARRDEAFGRSAAVERLVIVATWCGGCHTFLDRMTKDAGIRSAFRHVLFLDNDNLTAIGLLQSQGHLSAAEVEAEAAKGKGQVLYDPARLAEWPQVSFEVVEAAPMSALVDSVPFAMRCANSVCQRFMVPEWGLQE